VFQVWVEHLEKKIENLTDTTIAKIDNLKDTMTSPDFKLLAGISEVFT
jgi:hypothetical protein